MKGDFSSWRFDPTENFNGVLQQQGKVLLDRDWNEQTRINKHWQDTAGRDVIGPRVAAVPANDPKGFKVESAAKTVIGGQNAIELTLDPGRVWADGLLAYLPPADPSSPTTPVNREATYLQPPVQDPPGDISTLGDGVRDCVVLELSRESFNGFQWPDRLIEPALGGPDTTERIHTKLAFKLWRLADDEDCHTIHGKLQDDPSKFGKLTVSLQPTTVVPGDCPVVEGGGYTGFEHNLYRIEIADVTTGGPMFKWSQWNGGLVGRGIFDASGTPSKVTITANLTAIINSGLTGFYLEALAYDSDLGQWRVIYGANATLNSDNDLELGTTPVFGAFPTSADPVFFRLWNKIEAVSDYATGAPVSFKDGILLTFDAPGAGVFYRPGDYWTFPVRAGEIKNPDTLIDAQPPTGIVYHRVPLAVITWGPSLDTTVDGEIEDCRRRFRPLTQQDTCCTFRVGDGDTSIGDFEKIQDAIDALPPEGGEVCILPGTYTENVKLLNLTNVTLSGCGPRTIIQSNPPADELSDADPVISVIGGRDITIESLAVEADDSGPGILIQGYNYLVQDEADQARGQVRNATISEVEVRAGLKAAVRAEFVNGLVIRDCRLGNKDETNDEHTLVVLADNALIERNIIQVIRRVQEMAEFDNAFSSSGRNALGGLQLEGMCDTVRVVDNLIRGGSGHGITLGSLITVDDNGNPVPPGTTGGGNTPIDPCAPTQPAGVLIDEVEVVMAEGGTGTVSSGGALYEVTIERNRIYQMGVCGIGVVGFFDLSTADQFITVSGLNIIGNDIRNNLRRELAAIPAAKQNTMGYGGISLADVEDLVMRDNLIAENGDSAYDPVCGVFVLHAEGVEISRNRILENGMTVPDATTGQTAPKTGHRGGIVVVYGLSPATLGTVGTNEVALGTGAPAVKIHANVVTVPLGPALWMRALGPVSVLGNQLATRGIVQRSVSNTMIGAAVLIGNLGLSEEMYLQYLSYSAIAKGSVSPPETPGGAPSAIVLAPKAGLDDYGVGRLLANGNVLFADNQVLLNLIETGTTLTFAAIAIVTLDDISFHGNQCDCDLALDYVYYNTMLFGFSVRAHDNRFKEGFMTALFSAAVLGFMASASGNQATHCLTVKGFLPALTIHGPNSILMNAFLPNYCEKFAGFTESFGSQTLHYSSYQPHYIKSS